MVSGPVSPRLFSSAAQVRPGSPALRRRPQPGQGLGRPHTARGAGNPGRTHPPAPGPRRPHLSSRPLEARGGPRRVPPQARPATGPAHVQPGPSEPRQRQSRELGGLVVAEQQESRAPGFLPAAAAGRWASRRRRSAQARGTRSGWVCDGRGDGRGPAGGPAPAPTPGVRSPAQRVPPPSAFTLPSTEN